MVKHGVRPFETHIFPISVFAISSPAISDIRSSISDSSAVASAKEDLLPSNFTLLPFLPRQACETPAQAFGGRLELGVVGREQILTVHDVTSLIPKSRKHFAFVENLANKELQEFGSCALFDFEPLFPMNQKDAFNQLVGKRVKIARDQAGMSQTDLAEKLNLGKHQIISNIENGIRALSSDELFQLTEIYGVPAAFFTDPYRIVDEAVFSFRACRSAEGLSAFEDKVGSLASAAIRFSELCGEITNPFGQQLKIARDASPQVASALGTQVANRLGLGAIPAQQLQHTVEKDLGIMVLNIDAPEGFSGAACHMPCLDMIMINRNEPDFRRNFDLAHELFHVLTWTALPPQRHDWIDNSKPKAEKLADAFASGLLMPDKAMEARWAARTASESLVSWILRSAKEMKVSGAAFYYRLIHLRLLTKQLQAQVNAEQLRRSADSNQQPRLFCESFVQRMHTVVAQGKVSARKAASLVDLEVDELAPLFASYGLDSPL